MSDDMPVKIKDEPGPQGYPDEEGEPVHQVAVSSGSPERQLRGRRGRSESQRQTLLVHLQPQASPKSQKNVVVPTSSSVKVVKGAAAMKPATPTRRTFFVKPPPQGTPMPSSGAIVDQLLQSGLLQPGARVITNTGDVLKEGTKKGDEVLLYFGSQPNKNVSVKPVKTCQADPLLSPSEKSGMTFVVPTCVPGKKGPGSTKQVLVVHPPSIPGPTMTSILKSPVITTSSPAVKLKPALTSTPNSLSIRNPPALSLLKTPPALTPLSPIKCESSRTPKLSNPQVLGTVESVQAQAKAAMSIIGSIDKPRGSLQSGLGPREIKTTPPPKLHPIFQDRKLIKQPESGSRLCQIENVTSLVNGDVADNLPSTGARGFENDGTKKVINEEIETLSSHGSIFGLMRAFYTVTVPDHKPTAYKQFFCNFCKTKTWDQKVFLDHITTHLFVCGRCSFRSFSRAEVVSHIIKNHPEDKGELPSLHAMHLENVNLQFQGTKDGEKASVSNALAGSDITKMPKGDCQPVVVSGVKGAGQEEFKEYLEKNVKLGDNEIVYAPENDEDDEVVMDQDDDKTSNSTSTGSPMKSDEIERASPSAPPLKELGSITAPNLSVLAKMGAENRLKPDNVRMQYQCTNCDFRADSIEIVKDHFIQTHSSGKSHSIGYKSLPMKYYNLICPYCMLQMHDPEEIQHHLQLRHTDMLRKLVIAIRPIPTGPFSYVCSQCGASSPVKENMLGHILLEHETEHLLDALLYIYKAGVQRFIEHIRELIRQTFNYEQFNFPDMPESIPDAGEDFEGSQGSSVLSQEELEFVVLQDDPPKGQEGAISHRRSPTKVKIIQHYDNTSWSSGRVVGRAAKSESPVPGPKTLKDLPEAEVMFLEKIPPELLEDPRPHYNFNSTLKRASCKKCAFVTYGTNAQTHVREHVIGIHFRGRIWGCPYCSSLRMRRAEIIRHVVVTHPELPVKIVRRKPYEQQGSLSAVISKKTMVTSRVNSPARERLECWQCPFCLRRDASWPTMVNHLRFVHVDQEFKPVKWLRPTPKVKLEVTPELIDEVAKMKPFVFGVRTEDMTHYPPLAEVLNMEDTMQPEPSRTLMLNDSVANKLHKFGCKICDYTFATVQEIKTHIFAYHPGEELAIRDFRASKAPKGQTETTLFLCPGCQFTTKMVKALQVHSIKFPAHFSNVGNNVSPMEVDDSVKSLRSKELVTGVKRKHTARKSTAKSHQPPEKKQKLSRMCARKSTAKPHKAKKAQMPENSLVSENVTNDADKNSRMEMEDINTEKTDLKIAATDNKKDSVAVAKVSSKKSSKKVQKSEDVSDDTSKKLDKESVDVKEKPEKLEKMKSEKPVVQSEDQTENDPPEESKSPSKVPSEVVVDIQTDHLSLRCSICQVYNCTGVTDMKKHIVKKHYTMVPVAIDLVAKESKKPQRLHICTKKACPYVTYREWEFKSHINTFHTEAEFGFDVSLLHDGHVIRRNLWRTMPQPKPKKSPRTEEKDKKDISDFMKRRHEISRSRNRNSENGPTPGDRRSERVTRLNSRLSSSGEEANESSIISNSLNITKDERNDTKVNESTISNDVSKNETDTDSEKDSENEEEDANEEKKIMNSPQPPDPVHEPGEGSDGMSQKKKKSKKKKKSNKHMKHKKSKAPVVVTDPDGKRKVLYPYQGVDSVTVRYKCSHCELMTNDLNGLQNHLQEQHFQLDQKAVDLRRKAARQRSGLFFCPTGTCKMHTYEYEKYRCHECTHNLGGEDTLYQCKTCHLTTRDVNEMELHLEEHPAGYMLVDAKSVPEAYVDNDTPNKGGAPGSILGSALFKQNDFLS